MAAWKTCKLGEVCVLQRGHDLPRSAMHGGIIPVVGSQGIIGYHDCPTANAPCPGVTLGRSGSLGHPRLWAEPCWIHNTALYVKDFCGNDPRFVCYLLGLINYETFNGGGAVPTLNRNVLHQLSVSLPTLSEQERIAGVLGAYDDLIAVNVRRMALLEEAAHRLYRERFVTHADPSWPSRPLGEVAEVDPFIPVPKHKEEEPLFVSMGALDERSMCVDNFHAERRKSIGGSRFQNGDSLLARISPCLENGKAGFVMGLRPDEVAVGSTEFIVFRGKVWSGHMLYCLLRTPTFRGHAANSLRGADGRQRAQTPFLAAYRVPEPPPEAVAAFEAQVGPYFDAVGVLARENALLREARDGLLPRLLREEA